MDPHKVQHWAPANPPRWTAALIFLSVVLATLVLGLRESQLSDQEQVHPATVQVLDT